MKSNGLTASRVTSKDLAPGYYCDGGGLYLQVSRKYGTRSWVFRYVVGRKPNGRQRVRDMGLGGAGKSGLTLEQARRLARECREHLQRGDDPLELRRAKRDKARAETLGHMLFKDAAERFIALHAPTWKNAKHREQWPSTLKAYAYRTLGSRPVAAIDGALITEALAPIWMSKPETAKRVKQRIERVLQWVRDGMPLPQHGASKRVVHHSAMAFAALPDFMAELRQRNSISARALEVTVLCVTRTAETLNATWDEIDFDNAVWTVPAIRTKAAKAHDIPLSKRVLEILRDLPRVDKYIFPGAKAGQPLSNMAMLELLRGMAGNGYTVHGFRSSFRDWAGDQTHYAREVIEHALAHGIKDRAEAAYRRTTALEKRRRLMEQWAQFCSTLAIGATVTPIRGHA